MSTAIVWFRRDLRLEDNPAWAAATEAHDEIVPALVIEPALLDTAGPHRRRAFLTAAEALDRSITELGGRLHVRIGDPVRILPALAEEADAAAVYANADVSRWAQRRDTAVESALGVSIEWHWGTLAPRRAPSSPRPARSRGFHPFSKQWFAVPMRPEAVAHDIAVTTDPGDGLPASDGAESAVLAELRVDAWQADVDAYDDTRDLPAVDGTSRLSTALRFGTVSPDHSPRRSAPTLPAARASFASWRGATGTPTSPISSPTSIGGRSGPSTTASRGRPAQPPTRSSRHGPKAAPASQSSMPACASSPSRAGCTTGSV